MRKVSGFTVVVLGLAFLLAPAMVAWAQEEDAEPPARTESRTPPSQPPRGEQGTRKPLPPSSASPAASKGTQLTFPVFGEHHYSDDFGVPRPEGRTHHGIDIFAAKRTPVVAVMDGTVAWVRDADDGKCCSIGIEHADGWVSWYIHLNNDTDGTDDGTGFGISPELRAGSLVKAGQLIGYVGDSGNAEDTRPHLHFELHSGQKVVNPYPFLKAGILGPISAQGGLPHTGLGAAPLWAIALVLAWGGLVSLLVAPRLSVGVGRHKKRLWRTVPRWHRFPLHGARVR